MTKYKNKQIHSILLQYVYIYIYIYQDIASICKYVYTNINIYILSRIPQNIFHVKPTNWFSLVRFRLEWAHVHS